MLTYQVYIAQKKYGVVLDEIPEDTDEPELKLLRLLAMYLSKGVSEYVYIPSIIAANLLCCFIFEGTLRLNSLTKYWSNMWI